MAEPTKTLSPTWAWEPYKPSQTMPWNLQRAGHLYRRTSFGASWTELQTALKEGPDKTIDQLLKGGPGQDAFNAGMQPLADSLAQVNNGQLIRAWWLNRMLYSPHPLAEKMTLFWHNHFATSNAKVNNAGFMLGQYELMRKHALGSFIELLQGISRDPAMLIWLDGRDSKKGKPNENYARELMELFSLGLGHYTEKDIREAARAFTGWEIQGAQAVWNESQFDTSDKSVLGRSGPFKAEDIVQLCLDQKACPYFITGKLFRFLISETVPPTPALLEPLAERFRSTAFNFGQLVETMLRSNLFFSSEAYRSRIKSPVDFALGIVRALTHEDKLGTTALSESLRELGQNVFFPPSVKGWDGGQAWLNGQTLLYRQNLALALTSTEDSRFLMKTDPAALARRQGKTRDEEVVDFFLQLFLQGDVPPSSRSRLMEYMTRATRQNLPFYWTDEDAANHRIRSLAHLVLTLPEYQLD